MGPQTESVTPPNRLEQWAPYLGALGVALIVAAFILWVVLPAVPRAGVLGLGAVGVVLFALFLFTRPRAELREAFTGRTAIYGSNTVVLSLAFIGIVIVLYILTSTQLHGRLDLTANKAYTISDQSVNVLKSLTDTVKVTAFFTGRPEVADSSKQAQDQLNVYRLQTDKLAVSFVDPEANPTLAKAYDIAQDATLVFEHGDRREKVYTFDESTFTNAIMKVTQTQPPVVYFTIGHGEIDPTDSAPGGLSVIVNDLQQLNYKTAVLSLTTITATRTLSSGLPADTSLVVIAAPQKPFVAAEEQRLKTYLDQGGRVLLLVDPNTDPGLKDLLATWGLALNNDLVLDPTSNAGGYQNFPGILQFPTHDVTSNLQRFGGVFFPNVRSLKQVENASKSPTALFQTSTGSCGITDFEALKAQQTPQCDPSKDEQGPLTLGFAVETNAAEPNGKPSRLVVIGNAGFAANQWLQQGGNNGNRLLFHNAINWLAGQEQLIAIPPKASASRALNTLSNTDENIIAWSSVGLLPLFSLLIGGIIWWRRR